MYDIIIIGAGPSGLTAAANTSLRGLRSLVIEKQDSPGGLPTTLYPDKIIKDHPGFPVGILGKELSRMLFMQAKNAGAEIKSGEEVLKIKRGEDGILELKTVEDVYQAKKVILCTGIYDVPRKPKILEGYTGSNVHYKLERPQEFKKKVIIVGGGDHAFDTAVQLKDIAKSTTVLVRHRYAKAKRSTVELAKGSGVEVLYNTEIVKIFQDRSGRLGKVQVANKKTGKKNTINVDELFIAIGFEPIKSFLNKNGFKLWKREVAVKVDRKLQTNIKGVFAAGDVTGEVRLIATACAEGIVAAVHAFEEIKKPYWLQ